MPNNDNGNGNYSKPLDTVAIPTRLFWIVISLLISAGIAAYVKVYRIEARIEIMEVKQGFKHDNLKKSIERLSEKIDSLQDELRGKGVRKWGGHGKGKSGAAKTNRVGHDIEPRPMPLPLPVPDPKEPQTTICNSNKIKKTKDCSI